MDILSVKISDTLKKLQKERGLSLNAASQKTGVSKAMLGQIERGESSPTIATLSKIASGFDVSFSSFIEETEPHLSGFIHRKSELQQMHEQDKQIKIMSIFPFDENLRFEIFIIELLPGCTHISSPHQKGIIEHVIPVSGIIEVLINQIWHKVNQNEGVRFDAHLPHGYGYRNLSTTIALFHNIIHYPKL